MYEYVPMNYNEIINFIRCNNICTFAMAENDCPYAVPMCYESHFSCNDLYLTMRSKDCGKKMKYMYNNENVCIVIYNPRSCKSVIIYGIVNIENDCDCNGILTIKVDIKEATGREFCC